VGRRVIDHLVYATPELAPTVRDLGRRLGVELTAGGRHVGLGTMNFLAAIGSGAYLEVLGPDPDAPAHTPPFGLAGLTEPRLATWAVRVSDLAGAVERARAAGYDPGEIRSMSRRREDGVLLEWRLAYPEPDSGDGVVPFLIDWGDSPHPSAGAAPGAELLSFGGVHPRPDLISAKLAALGVSLPVTEGPRPALRAVLRTPAGEVELS
jgi:hypothetical protein